MKERDHILREPHGSGAVEFSWTGSFTVSVGGRCPEAGQGWRCFLKHLLMSDAFLARVRTWRPRSAISLSTSTEHATLWVAAPFVM